MFNTRFLYPSLTELITHLRPLTFMKEFREPSSLEETVSQSEEGEREG